MGGRTEPESRILPPSLPQSLPKVEMVGTPEKPSVVRTVGTGWGRGRGDAKPQGSKELLSLGGNVGAGVVLGLSLGEV